MKILINGMLGSGNLGDDLISYFLVHNIQKKYPQSELIVLSGDQPISFYMKNDNLKIVKRATNKLTIDNLRKKREIKNYLKNIDKIIIGGGGLLQDVHHISNINYWINIINSKSDNFLVGMGIGPINNKSNTLLLKFILKYFNVQVRDMNSHTTIKQLGINSNISSDIVAGSNISILFSPKKKGSTTLGIAIRPWAGIEYSEIINLINFAVSTKNIEQIYLFTFEYSERNLEEYEFNLALQKTLKTTGIETKLFTYNKDEWKYFKRALESVDYGIASRLHANVIWQKLKIPIIPISYDDKVNAFYSGYKINDVRTKEYMHKKFILIKSEDHYKLPELKIKTKKPSWKKSNYLKGLNFKFATLQIINSIKIRLKLW